MTIEFYNTQDPSNKVSKALSNKLTITGTLRESCSILTPSLMIDYDGVFTYNYCYIPDFQRYYFVSEITMKYNGLVRVDLSVDVLMSYQSDILKQNCVISRNENEYNLYLPDGSFKSLSQVRVQTKIFPDGFNDDGTFILVVAGPVPVYPAPTTETEVNNNGN